ncbi:3-hydroxyacyl-CoA dehydrogenase NAD-binding domain-containing protein [Spartinivicinus poritis]|uniref:3-hydroxyacyl-CoA dehydrogenase NAD-binding domain-containing protein n=1 Tax=Spartinivicinus poritis TaxID=2994640 RepID=A0ABT5U9H3_9GAMM|nr:3-hydroxyacyl-CoA dehydrogenase NAD-binding domain-containing protein [Spartinivicinus sp. A2-2]MDE1462661.1 3-hydroxyacyl-CoA dehydrogenase NAD-binding domain-containing protein [Spartinivicinus sp. A2-2]
MTQPIVSRLEPTQVSRAGVIGTGTIGGAWALHFLRMGMDVVAYDPGPNAQQNLLNMVEAIWPTMKELGLREGASPKRLSFANSMEELTQRVQVIQESTPENLTAKRQLFAELDSITPPDVVIISSTSGFAMTDMQVNCEHHPERFVVGHPFNPPYLIPFCEVVGGEQTSPDAVDWTAAFYESIEKQVAKMDKELPGFIGNRLQEALWREALHMVANNECSVEDIDKSIAYGMGLRWAIMGHCLTYHLGGGQGGMAHLLDHFAPALKEPWTRLEAPELTPALRDAMVQGCLNQAEGRSINELVKERDDCLIRIINTLKEYKANHGIQR